ncbi:folate family ECF transporter S component [Candidatus Saccharibacteria bacterium]|nr:folate family ECF transporter S component [Candidatus Saccharibacteria bacterium]
MKDKNFNVKTESLAMMAICVALAILFGNGRVLSLTIGPFRISIGNLPIVLAGIMFGPACGAMAGVAADLLSCALVGYVPIPLVTVGAGCVGGMAGLTYRKVAQFEESLRVSLAVTSGHVVGSMIVKTVGLVLTFGYPLIPTLIGRIVEYALIGAIECVLAIVILKGLRRAGLFRPPR